MMAFVLALLPLSAAAMTITIDETTSLTAHTVTINETTSPEPTPTTPTVTCADSGVEILSGTLQEGLHYFNFYRGQAYALTFTGQPGDKGLIAYGASTKKGNGYTNKVAVISECKGALDTTKAAKFCANFGIEGGLYYKFGTNDSGEPLCELDPNKTYYYNISNYNSCPSGMLCGFTLNFLRYRP